MDAAHRRYRWIRVVSSLSSLVLPMSSALQPQRSPSPRAARLVSVTGGDAAYIALVALVYDRTGSSLWVSAALLAMIGVGGICRAVRRACSATASTAGES